METPTAGLSLRDRALAGLPLEGELIVDAHGHLGRYGPFNMPTPTAEEAIVVMDRVGVDVLCVSHVLSLVGDYTRGNDLVGQAIRDYPGRFLGYAVANPNYPQGIRAELERCVEELGMRAIKVHNSLHDYPVDGPAMMPIYEYAAERGLPVLGHGFGDARAMDVLTKRFPTVDFIVAHSGGGYRGRPEPVVELAAERDNLYLDVCSSLVPNGGIEALVGRVGAGKILFGSDFTWQHLTHQIGRVLLADLTEADKRAILGGNAARIFGLGGGRRE